MRRLILIVISLAHCILLCLHHVEGFTSDSRWSVSRNTRVTRLPSNGSIKISPLTPKEWTLAIHRNSVFGGSATRRYSQSNGSPEDNLFDRVNWLEVRLDATIVACFALCRFLVYDIATGAKDVPGFELHDVIGILECFSSGIILSLYWTIVGIFLTEQLLVADDDERPTLPRVDQGEASAFFPAHQMTKLLATVVITSTCWLTTESILGFTPPGVIQLDGVGLVAGTLGLGATIFTAKMVSQSSL